MSTPPAGIPPYRPAIPPELEPESFAAALYAMLGPLAQWDAEVVPAFSLLAYVSAVGVMFQQVEDLVRDSAEGPGWSVLMDLPRCPPYALAWLGQFVGVRLLPETTPDEERDRIRATDGFRRGTRSALIAAALPTLTGLKRIDVRERAGGPLPELQTYGQVKAEFADYAAVKAAYVDYLHLRGYPGAAYFVQVRTYGSETPNPGATLGALLSQKPGGLVLDYVVITGQTYGDVKARFASYADVKATYSDYLAVRQDEPPDF